MLSLFRHLCLVSALALAGLPLLAVPPASKTATYQFCFWNVENFFDDKPDPTLKPPDKDFDTWFAKDKEALKQKLDKVCQVLLHKDMNGGKGPDIIALAEVESQRVADLIKDELNRRTKGKAAPYKEAVYKNPGGLRKIACVVLSRVPVVSNKTKILGRYQRILKVVVEDRKKELTIIASHWTSNLSDKDGSKRANYAKAIYRDFDTAYKNNKDVDYLVCGDFNDTPEAKSVTASLMATEDTKKVLGLGKGDKPLFYNPFVDLAKKGEGTHYFRGKAYLFDQICLSPGLLDGEGWSYKNKSARIVKQLAFRGMPDRFGGPNDRRPWKNRGASDHFPVVIELTVSGK